MLTSKPPTSKPASTGYKHWLGGLLRCENCGGTLTFGTTYTRRNDKTYVCQKYSCNNYMKGKCSSSNSISIRKIEKEVIELLQETSELFSRGCSLDQFNVRIDEGNEKELIAKQISKLDNKLVKAKEAYLAEVDTLEEYKANKKTIQIEKDKLIEKLNFIHEPKEISSVLQSKCENVIVLLKNQNVSIDEKNKALKGFIDCIKYNKKRETLDLFMFFNSSST